MSTPFKYASLSTTALLFITSVTMQCMLGDNTRIKDALIHSANELWQMGNPQAKCASLDIIRRVVHMGYESEEAEKSFVIGFAEDDPNVKSAALKLFAVLVSKGQAIKTTTRLLALNAIADDDSKITMEGTKFLESLITINHAFIETPLATTHEINQSTILQTGQMEQCPVDTITLIKDGTLVCWSHLSTNAKWIVPGLIGAIAVVYVSRIINTNEPCLFSLVSLTIKK